MNETRLNQPALVALSREELAHFFPGALQDRLNALLPRAVFVDPVAVNGDWPGLLHRVAPRVLVSGWRTPAVPDAAVGLDYVCHVTGSVRHILPRRLLERGVLVTNWGETVADSVAEGALMLVISALRRSHHFADVMHRQKGWRWAPAGALSLFGRRVGLHGFGAVARHLLPLLAPFRVEVRAFSEGVPPELFAAHGVERAGSLDELFRWADVLIEAESCPESRCGVVNAALIAQLRPGAVFVNVARGHLVDEAALTQAVVAGRIRVGLDVYTAEPLAADSPLRGHPDAVLFPHLAGPTDDRFAACGEHVLANLARYAAGEKPAGLITPEIYDRST